MSFGFIKVGAYTPEIKVADVNFNTENIKKGIEEADKNYWSSLDEKVEQVNGNPFLEGNGALGAENGNTDKMQIYYQGTKSRVYFLIGNVLMDKNINVLYE